VNVTVTESCNKNNTGDGKLCWVTSCSQQWGLNTWRWVHFTAETALKYHIGKQTKLYHLHNFQPL